MTFKSLMVHLDPNEAASSRLKVAVDLARRFEARLVGASAAQPARAAVSAAIPPLSHVYEEQCADCMTSLRHTFDLEAAGLRTDWRGDFGSPAGFLAEQARCADLVIVEGAGPGHKAPQFELEAADLLMTAGRPILFVPPQMDCLLADKVVVGWKAGRHARLALQQALPLLAFASEVTVIGVGPESSQAELDDVAAYLQTHGVPARGQWQDVNGGTPAQALVAAAVIGGADLIVSGGFGRGRVREWVLGGVTKDLLAGCPSACLMAH